MIGLNLFTAWAGLQLAALTVAAPAPQASTASAAAAATTSSSSTSSYWVASIARQGAVAFGNSTNYTVFRNVMDYGATGMLVYLQRWIVVADIFKVMGLPTILMQSILLFHPVTAVVWAANPRLPHLL